MGTTYLGLVNKLLTRLNETELTTDNFKTARGIHAAAKQAILDANDKVQNTIYQLNVNAAEHRMDLVPGVPEYSWPPSFKSADWNSFYLVKNNGFNINNHSLTKINKQEWQTYSRNTDNDQLPVGRGVPQYVFESHGHGFGVSPAPLESYTICFRYYFNQTALVEPNDECNLPSHFDYVVLNGASYYMKLFKEDTEQAGAMATEFKSGLSDLRALLMTRKEYVTDSRLPRQGNARGFF